MGDSVTVTVNGVAYSGLVAPGNSYSINVPGAGLLADGDKTVDASVSASDGAGNSITASAAHAYTVDTAAAASITINSITADDIVNAAEAGGLVAVSGSVGGDAKVGDSVTVTVNGVAYSGLVAPGNSYSINVPGAGLLADGDKTVDASVSASDGAGNSITASAAHAYTVDTAAAASITINSITADDIVNAAEAGGLVAVSGSVGGDAKVGDSVTVTVNGVAYSGLVAPGNSYSINVPGAGLLADGDKTVDASVSASDGAGNSITASAAHAYTVDTAAAASITINSITADDIVNAAEAGGLVAVSGSVGGDAKVGDSVTVTVNGVAYSGLVAPGNSYSINVPGAGLLADGDKTVDASVSASDGAGNSITASAAHAYTVDTAAAASITINSITADDIVNAAEAGGLVAVSGSVGGDAKVGDSVTVTVNGVAYSGLVAPGNSYSINVPGAGLLADGDKTVDASVSATDGAGNSITASAAHAYRRHRGRSEHHAQQHHRRRHHQCGRSRRPGGRQRHRRRRRQSATA